MLCATLLGGARVAADEGNEAVSRRPSGSRRSTRRTPDRGTGRQRSESAADGRDYERRLRRLAFAEGALARRRVPVFVDAEAGRTQLTDLDVVAVDFDRRLRVSHSLLECKSGSG